MKRATKQRLSLAAIMVLLLSGCGSVGKETKKQEQQVFGIINGRRVVGNG